MSPAYLNVVLRPLKYEYFEKNCDDENTINAKRAYVTGHNQSYTPYNFKDQGLKYLFRVTFGLALFSLDYVTESINFQIETMSHLGDPNLRGMKFLNPLCAPFVSNGQFIFAIFRHFDLNKRDIKAIPRENVGLTKNKVSLGECQWVYFL